MITREAAEHLFKDVLNNLYSPAHLETHPLAELLLGAEPQHASRSLALRELVIEEIESLRPREAVSFARPEWLPYRIMAARYVEGQTVDEICSQIGLGRTTFYRYHGEALEALANRVWQRMLRAQAATDRREAPTPSPANLATAEAVRLTTLAPREWVQPTPLLQETIALIANLAQQLGVRLEPMLDALPAVYVNPAMLRQGLISLLTVALKHAANNILSIRSVSEAGSCTLVLERLGPTLDESTLQSSERLAMASAVFAAYGGALTVQHKLGEHALHLSLPCQRPRTALVIDDNEEAVTLYRRYLRNANYVVHAVERQEDPLDAVARLTPDVILLDLLMPGRDGWRLLQQLAGPSSQSAVPVIICSVLRQPELALSLGAAAVLQKPISQEHLLAALQDLYPDASPSA
jgi:CheY-like chemotaxis protein